MICQGLFDPQTLSWLFEELINCQIGIPLPKKNSLWSKYYMFSYVQQNKYNKKDMYIPISTSIGKHNVPFLT